MNTVIEKIRALINMQIRREELNFASLGGGGQTMNIGALEWVLKQLDTLQEQPVKNNALFDSCLAKVNPETREEVRKNIDKMIEQPVWHDVEKETPTSFGEGVIVLCKNKNKEDGIWLTDFIPCWEGEWKPMDNWETPVKWAYVRDFYPKAEQSVTLSVQDAMKSLDEKIAKVKKAGSWKNSELLDEMREEHPVCEELGEELVKYIGYPEENLDGKWKKKEVEEIARHFYELGKQSKPTTAEGLEEEINRLSKNEYFDFADWKAIARHFAQWGAEHRGSSEIPNDLEEAARKHSCYDEDCEGAWYEPIVRNAFIAGAKWQKEKDSVPSCKNLYDAIKENQEKKSFHDDFEMASYAQGMIDGSNWQKEQMMDEWLKDRDGCFWDGVEEGKKAMREQMMKEAVEGTYNNSDWGTPCIDLPSPLELERFDKVRIIIVKED